MTLKKIGNVFFDIKQIAAITDFETDHTDKYKATIITSGGAAVNATRITRHEVVQTLEKELEIQLIDHQTDIPL